MGITISETELSKNLSDVLNRIYYRGERFTVARNGEAVAFLGPTSVSPSITLRQLVAQMGGLPLPDADFADDVEAMRGMLVAQEPPTWSR